MTTEPRIIKYESDKFIKKGDYYGAVWECLKESGVLFNKRSEVKKDEFKTDRRKTTMTKEELLKEFKKLKKFDIKTAHIKADELLLQYINDIEITKVFDKLEKWYS